MMRIAAVPGYSAGFPVTYRNMYNDYQMTTAGFGDPFSPSKAEQHTPCNLVVSYTGQNDPKYQLNNPAYMREVMRSYSDSMPQVVNNRKPVQNL
jgi:hypothetical protein